MSGKLRQLSYGQLGKSVIYWKCCKQRSQAARLKATCSLFVLYLPKEGVCPTFIPVHLPVEIQKAAPQTHLHQSLTKEQIESFQDLTGILQQPKSLHLLLQ